MKKTIVERLNKLCDEGEKLTSSREVSLWSDKVSSFLSTAISQDESRNFESLKSYDDEWSQHALRLGHIQGLISKESSEKTSTEHIGTFEAPESSLAASQILSSESRKVFVVHGHDNEAKESTARFLEKLGLQPIILHEQPSSGRTVIEKFESYASDIAFAVVLLTPDDVGTVATSPANLKARARQNVVMELGYFMGRLGRVRVCALHKGGIELPSDYQGVLYIEMDIAGAWKGKLAQEFVQAKLPIELSGLLGG
ncbi:MAG: nucleotide-binding protein [Methylococcaceae bacterium]